MQNAKKVVIAELVNGKKFFALRRKNSMAKAVAERTLYELVLTDKWDHLFKSAYYQATETSYAMGCDEIELGYVDAFSTGRLPRLLVSDFLNRAEETENTLTPTSPGYRVFRFVGVNKNDSITITVGGKGDTWKPTAVQVSLLAEERRYTHMLYTTDLIIA